VRGLRRLAGWSTGRLDGRERSTASQDARSLLDQVRAGFDELAQLIAALHGTGAFDRPPGLDARTRKQRGKALSSTRLGYARIADLLGRYLVLESDGRAFVISPADAKMFERRKTNEARLLHAALRHMEDAGVPVVRDILVDGGANVGTECLAALAAGFTSVIACEPERENFRLLRANVALNGEADRVHALEVALSSEGGRARLDPGDRTRRKARLVGQGEESQANEVRVASLDDLASEGVFDPARVGLLWLDVEGYECHVLRGAALLLERAVPIVMELNLKLLDRAGTLHDLPGVFSRRYGYTHMLDLRPPRAGFEPLNVSDLIARYAPEGGTNVLVARIPR
jgi:FkbM family methyltransferase